MSSASETLEPPARGCFVRAFAGVLRIECTDDGSSVWVDGRQDTPLVSLAPPPEVSSRFCLWRGPAQVLHAVLSGRRRLETAYMSGQVRISGDMAVMAKLELERAP